MKPRYCAGFFMVTERPLNADLSQTLRQAEWPVWCAIAAVEIQSVYDSNVPILLKNSIKMEDCFSAKNQTIMNFS